MFRTAGRRRRSNILSANGIDAPSRRRSGAGRLLGELARGSARGHSRYQRRRRERDPRRHAADRRLSARCAGDGGLERRRDPSPRSDRHGAFLDGHSARHDRRHRQRPRADGLCRARILHRSARGGARRTAQPARHPPRARLRRTGDSRCCSACWSATPTLWCSGRSSWAAGWSSWSSRMGLRSRCRSACASAGLPGCSLRSRSVWRSRPCCWRCPARGCSRSLRCNCRS